MDGGWRGGEGGHFLPTKFNRFPQNSTDSHKIQQIRVLKQYSVGFPTKFNRFPQNSTDSHKIQQIRVLKQYSVGFPTKFNRSEF